MTRSRPSLVYCIIAIDIPSYLTLSSFPHEPHILGTQERPQNRGTSLVVVTGDIPDDPSLSSFPHEPHMLCRGIEPSRDATKRRGSSRSAKSTKVFVRLIARVCTRVGSAAGSPNPRSAPLNISPHLRTERPRSYSTVGCNGPPGRPGRRCTAYISRLPSITDHRIPPSHCA
jgi:hypothetical protein